MDKRTDKGDQKQKGSDELDLTALRDFNFAANWSESAAPPVRKEESGRSDGEIRERRPHRRPAGSKGMPSHWGHRNEPRSRGGRPPRRGLDQRRQQAPDAVLLREYPFEIQLFPDEPVLETLTKAMRQSIRTYELFEVARLILEKNDRFHVSFRFKQDPGTKLFQAVPDGVPFTSEEAAVDHVVRTHLDRFFEIEEVDAEPPKGNFQFIARCTLTGDFLGPPNYHRYQTTLLQYHQEHFPEMPIENFRASIETVADEEEIEKWMQSMTKQNRYKIIGEETILETPEDARAYLLQHKKNEVVRATKNVRFLGKELDKITDPAIRPYLLAYIDYQRRFPLDTANSLRGRLRRQHFFIYKKGSRGISYVCAAKRQYRRPDQVFSETIGDLIRFLEKNELIYAKDLSEKMLGIPTPAAESDTKPTAEEEEKLKRLHLDLRWLVSEGYVTEYSDGRLLVHPVSELPTRTEPQKKAESEPENQPKAKSPAAEEKSSEKPAETAESPSEGSTAEAVDESESNESETVEPESPSADLTEPPVQSPAEDDPSVEGSVSEPSGEFTGRAQG